MSNTPAISTTLSFFQPTYGLSGLGKLIRLVTGAPYKVLSVQYTDKETDYGILRYTRLVIQRDGGRKLTIPWGKVEAIPC